MLCAQFAFRFSLDANCVVTDSLSPAPRAHLRSRLLPGPWTHSRSRCRGPAAAAVLERCAQVSAPEEARCILDSSLRPPLNEMEVETGNLHALCSGRFVSHCVLQSASQPGVYECQCHMVSCDNCSVCDGSPLLDPKRPGGKGKSACVCMICRCSCNKVLSALAVSVFPHTHSHAFACRSPVQKGTVGSELKNLTKQLSADLKERKARQKELASGPAGELRNLRCVSVDEWLVAAGDEDGANGTVQSLTTFLKGLSPIQMLQVSKGLQPALPSPLALAEAAGSGGAGSAAAAGFVPASPSESGPNLRCFVRCFSCPLVAHCWRALSTCRGAAEVDRGPREGRQAQRRAMQVSGASGEPTCRPGARAAAQAVSHVGFGP